MSRPRFRRPLAELFFLLAVHDYAPPNAASWFGMRGTASMLPVALVGVTGYLALLRHQATLRQKLLTVAMSAGITVVAVSGLSYGTSTVPPYEWIALIARKWNPKGHDAIARLESEMQRNPSQPGFDRLIEMYLAEGRQPEAEGAQRRRDMLSQRKE